METTKSKTGILKFPFHPLLLCIYPILFVYALNLVYIPFQDIVRFLALSIGISTFFLLGFRVVLRDWEKAGVLSSLLSCLFYSFGHIAIALEKWLHRRGFGFNVSVLGWTWLVVFILLAFFVVRFKLPNKTTQFLNLMSGMLIIFSSWAIITAVDVNSDTSQLDQEKLAHLRGEAEAEGSLRQVPSSELPDVYYIISDGYLRADYLYELFGYDNSSFINALEQRGFYIVSSSHSNYLNTNYSLNTSLNLMYFHEFPERIFNKAKHNLLTNYVVNFLKKNEYQTVVFDSGTGDTNNQDADIFITQKGTNAEEKRGLNAFEQFFLRTTMGLLFFSDQSLDSNPEKPNGMIRSTVNQELSLRRDRISHTLTHLPDYASKNGHYFLFAHIYLPHIPFLYGPGGEELSYHENLNIYWYEVEPENYIEYYNYQIDYINQALLDTIDLILTNSKKPVVIVLQSDHGDEKFLDRDAPTTQGINVRSAIINAIYFSDQNYDGLYPTMTPVNTFRVVFNHWFGTQYPLLTDQVFFHEHPLSTRINEKPEFVDACVHFNICLPSSPY
ncbi:MAG: hypothetical protein WBB69_04180 [Anaerolineales bacterium]